MARHGSIRASDAERDTVVERLRLAAAEGRLSAAQLDARVHRALTALTHGELSALVRDLPDPDSAPDSAPAGIARRALRPQRRVAAWSWQLARTHPAAFVVAVPFVIWVGAMLFALAVVSMVVVAVAMVLGAQVTSGARRRRHTAASIS